LGYLLSGDAYACLGNVYGIRHDLGLVLIDSGLDEGARDRIDESMVRWDLADLPITHLIITHGRNDHAGKKILFTGDVLSASGLSGSNDINGVAFGWKARRTTVPVTTSEAR
jgi:mRNA degradation ribonuclease J1/J2